MLDECSAREMSYCSHWETSFAVQSDTRSFECDGQIPHQQSLHAHEKKPSNAIGMFLDDTAGVFMCSVPQRNETVCCAGSINDCLMNPVSLLNAVHIDAPENALHALSFVHFISKIHLPWSSWLC
jgi:hypothetical protein